MPALRGLRGSVVGLSATGLGLAGHMMAGGALPSPPVVALAAAALVLLGVAMSSREWGLPSLLTVLVGAQLALHVVLAGGAQAPAMPGMTDGGTGAMGGMAGMGTLPGVSMSGAHVVAAVVTALLLRRGEQWCLSLVGLLSRTVRAIELAVVPLPRPRTLSVQTPPHGARTWHLSPSLSRRGPPALSPA